MGESWDDQEAIKEAVKSVGELLRCLAEDDGYWRSLARMMSRWLQAMIAEGFTREEALAILQHAGANLASFRGK
jgi:hypothetical protein